MTSPSASGSSASGYSIAPSAISPKAECRPATTGVPHAIASITGSPKPSWSDGKTNISDRL